MSISLKSIMKAQVLRKLRENKRLAKKINRVLQFVGDIDQNDFYSTGEKPLDVFLSSCKFPIDRYYIR